MLIASPVCKPAVNIASGYLEDTEDPVKFRFPVRELLFIVLRVEGARNSLVLTPFCDLPLNVYHRSVIMVHRLLAAK